MIILNGGRRHLPTNRKDHRGLASVGIEKAEEELEVRGRKIFDEKYRFKRREGFDLEKAMMPSRFYETVSPRGWSIPRR